MATTRFGLGRFGPLIEAIREVTAGREAHGRFLLSATVELFEDHGFTRRHQVGRHARVVDTMIEAAL
ncbi:MAG TPA: hypothetical protein VF065_15880 [Ilumatobacter sp.]